MVQYNKDRLNRVSVLRQYTGGMDKNARTKWLKVSANKKTIACSNQKTKENRPHEELL